MPTIPQYRQQTLPQSGGMPRAQATPEIGIGGALSAVGDAGMQAAYRLQRQQEIDADRQRVALEKQQRDDAHVEAAKVLSDARLQWTEQLLKAKESAPPGAAGLTPEILKQYDDYSKQAMADRPNPYTQKLLNEGLTNLRTHIGQDALTFEAGARIDNRINTLEAGINKTAQAVLASPAQRSAALAEQMALIDAMEIPPKQKEAMKERALQTIDSAGLNGEIGAARKSPTALDALLERMNKGEFPGVPAQNLAAAEARVMGYRSVLEAKREAAARRAEAEDERVLKRAEAEFNTFQALADKGTLLAPEYVDRAVAATAGTPYQQGIRALAQQSVQNGGLAYQPIAAQRKTLGQVDALIAQQGRTPELDKRREQIVKVLHGSETDLRENGLRAGLERGVISDMAPLDVSTPPALVASVTRRIEQAEAVSLWAGKAVSPLDASEADQVRGMLDALPPKLRAEAVATMAQAIGPRFSGALAQQIDKQDKPLALAFAMAGAKTTAGRHTSELILKGATAIKDGTAMKDDKKVTGWKATIAAEVEGLFPDERLATATKEAAYFIAAGIAQENGGSIGSSDIERAVRLAVGGSIIERNGKKLPIPAGMDDDDFDARLRTLPAGDILKQAPDGKVLAGGVAMPAADFAASIPGQELMPAGNGRYAVIVRGRPVTNAAGRPIIVEVK